MMALEKRSRESKKMSVLHPLGTMNMSNWQTDFAIYLKQLMINSLVVSALEYVCVSARGDGAKAGCS